MMTARPRTVLAERVGAIQTARRCSCRRERRLSRPTDRGSGTVHVVSVRAVLFGGRVTRVVGGGVGAGVGGGVGAWIVGGTRLTVVGGASVVATWPVVVVIATVEVVAFDAEFAVEPHAPSAIAANAKLTSCFPTWSPTPLRPFTDESTASMPTKLLAGSTGLAVPSTQQIPGDAQTCGCRISVRVG
jgi:hypothetical protein